ncbi:MAG TPA: DoxX family protein [Gemmatimonadales bacterium]|nr:DoxX family protein [Gemmatimonadales bacterium]
MDEGLLIIRLAFGLTLAAHGAQKLFGMFGGYGIAGTAGWLDSQGFRPGRAMAIAAGSAETFGGLALAAGLLVPFTAGAIVATMIVAIWAVHRSAGFFSTNGGYELPLLIAAAALGIAATGPGALSVDAALGFGQHGIGWALVALGLGIFGAVPPLLTRAASLQKAGSTVQA